MPVNYNAASYRSSGRPNGMFELTGPHQRVSLGARCPAATSSSFTPTSASLLITRAARPSRASGDLLMLRLRVR